ncbi:ATPase V [Ruminococcaceae bacterium AM28-23LB]|nr:ATPase V [Ruminococcaceae bacterium AM28-23LB]
MAIEKMKLVNIVGPLGLFDQVVRGSLVDSGFAPESVLDFVGSGGGLLPFTLRNPNGALLSRSENLLDKLNIEPEYRPFPEEGFGETEMTGYFDDLTRRYQAIVDQKEGCRRPLEEDEQILGQLDHIMDVKANLDDLFDLHYAKLRVGRIPRDIYVNYVRYVEQNPDIFFFTTGESGDYVYGMYITPAAAEGKSDALFSSLHFERIHISDQVHGSPDEAKKRLEEEMEEYKKKMEEADRQMQALRDSEQDRLLTYYSMLKYDKDTYDLRRYAAHTNDTFYLCGWIPQQDLPAFEKRFSPFRDSVYVLEEPPTAAVAPPTKLKNRGPIRFFEQFVEMYGLPAYNEADPTFLLALSYTLFFGVMFGDVGQGAVLILAGLLAWRILKLSLGKIIAVVGCSSVVFGFVYGSVFGNEDLLPGFKVFENVDNTNKILLCSVAMGLLFISIAMIYNIYNGIRQKDLGKALFSQNGVAGFIFYWAVIVGVLCTLLTNIKLLSPVYIALLILLPLLLIFAQKPLGALVARRKDWMPKEKGGFIVENFFELFEILLSFVSNTVSFVRIGAFALNHVGMMMVVFALMDSVGTIGSPIVFVIGNVFVMCLEGLIVGIQVLRLEFYELFGRFYSGTGVPYQPFTVHFRREKKS